MMTNQQMHECSSAVVVVALNAYAGEQLEKRANDLALPTAGVGALGLGAAGAGLGSGLAGLLSGTPRDAEEEERLKNRKRLAALALGIPGAALGGYLGHRLGTGSGTLEDVMAKLSPEAIKGYWARMRADPISYETAQDSIERGPIDYEGAQNAIGSLSYEEAMQGIKALPQQTRDDVATDVAAGSLNTPSYGAGKHITGGNTTRKAVTSGWEPQKPAPAPAQDFKSQFPRAAKESWNTAGMAPNYMRTQLGGNLR